MVSWLPQYLIPVGFALIVFPLLFPIARRQILVWSPLTWIADFDYLVQSVHRAWLHTLWIPLLLFAAVIVLWRRRDASARFWEYATRPGTPGGLLLASYYWFSHVMLDVFQGGSVLFYPLTNTNFFFSFQILLNTETNTFQTAARGGTSEGPPALSPLYPWFSSEHNAILLFLLIMALIVGAVHAWRRYQEGPPPVVVAREATLASPIHKE